MGILDEFAVFGTVPFLANPFLAGVLRVDSDPNCCLVELVIYDDYLVRYFGMKMTRWLSTRRDK